jgi:hypothetical protein
MIQHYEQLNTTGASRFRGNREQGNKRAKLAAGLNAR